MCNLSQQAQYLHYSQISHIKIIQIEKRYIFCPTLKKCISASASSTKLIVLSLSVHPYLISNVFLEKETTNKIKRALKIMVTRNGLSAFIMKLYNYKNQHLQKISALSIEKCKTRNFLEKAN